MTPTEIIALYAGGLGEPQPSRLRRAENIINRLEAWGYEIRRAAIDPRQIIRSDIRYPLTDDEQRMLKWQYLVEVGKPPNAWPPPQYLALTIREIPDEITDADCTWSHT